MWIKFRRLLALYIDFIIIFYLCYYFVKLISIFDNIYYDIFIEIVGFILFINLFLRKDCFIGYESIGKKVMFLHIYQNNIRVKDKKVLIDRVSASFYSCPFYLFMILINNKSFGDRKLATDVK